MVISPSLPYGDCHDPCRVLLQVFMVKASGEVFVNQIYTQLPVSAGKGARPGPTSGGSASRTH